MGIRILVFCRIIPIANYAHFEHYCGKAVNKAYNYFIGLSTNGQFSHCVNGLTKFVSHSVSIPSFLQK
jgi:hypothetical protein